MRITKSILPVILCIAVLSTVVQSQTAFHEIDSGVHQVIVSSVKSPGALDTDRVNALLAQVGDRAELTGLQPIEKFLLPYYAGYLHYISGLTGSRPNAERDSSFILAREWFARSVTEYPESLEMPRSHSFAEYMQGWTLLRRYLLNPGRENVPLLHDAVTLFGELLQSENAGFLSRDIRFLRGLSSYLIATESFSSFQADSLNLDRAIRDFSEIQSKSGGLSELSKFYAALAHYQRARYAGIDRLRGRQLTESRLNSARADFRTAGSLLNQLAVTDTLGLLATAGYNLSLLQGSILRTSENQRVELFLNDLDTGLRTLFEGYAGFLYYLRTGRILGVGEKQVGTEAGYWDGIRRYLTTLTGDGSAGSVRTTQSLLTGINTDERRSRYLKSLGQVYSRELEFIQGNTVETDEVDGSSLLANHSKRNVFINGYMTLREELSREGFDIWLLEDVDLLVDNVPEIMAEKIESLFGDPEVINQFAHYLLTMAERNRSLYPTAYMLFEYLDLQGYHVQEMTLLKAFCEYQMGRFQTVLALLDTETLSGFVQGNRSEAIYYRAMAQRQITGLRFAPEVVAEFERIKNHHPYAGYAMAYEMNPEDIDQDLLDIVGTQACADPRFTDLCQAAGEIGYVEVDTPPEVQVGEKGVRFERLQNLMEEYIAEEREYLSSFWQVFSLSLPAVLPAESISRECDLPGPREFYLKNSVDVHFTLGYEGFSKEISVFPEVGECQTLTSTAGAITVSLLPLRNYRIVVSKAGSYPVVDEREFTTNNQTWNLSDRYHTAVEISGESRLVPERAIETLVRDFADDYYLIEQSEPRAVRVGKVGGSGIDYLSGIRDAYSAITRVGQNYYVIEGATGEIRRFSDEVIDPKPVAGETEKHLNNPVDLTGYGDYLFVVNAGNNTIARLNVNSGNWSVSSPLTAGRLGSLTVLDGSLFISDWQENTIYAGDLSLDSFAELQSVEAAREDGMIAPGNLSSGTGDFLVLSDPRANALFLFYGTGEYLGRWDHPDFTLPGPVDFSPERNRLLIGQADGFRVYPLSPNPDYHFSASCDEPGSPDRAPFTARSWFCVPELR